MVHAHPEPRSYGSEDTTKIHAPAQASQAAKRAAYIARVVAEAPPLTAAQIDRLAGIFSPAAERTNATPVISEATWSSWEMKRHIQATETPGIHGTYGNEVAA